MTGQPWWDEAKKNIGVKEIPGPKHNPIIIKWLENLNAWWKNDEDPYCGVFIAHCMQVSKIPYPKLYMRALEWINWGVKLAAPVPGCIVIFTRKGGGHVSIVDSINSDGTINCLGANQDNQVKISKFVTDRIAGYRYPVGYDLPTEKLTVVDNKENASINEA